MGKTWKIIKNHGNPWEKHHHSLSLFPPHQLLKPEPVVQDPALRTVAERLAEATCKIRNGQKCRLMN
jgi:hypothetical protein